MTEAADSCQESTAAERNRYVSFIGLDCAGQARRLIGLLQPYMEDPEKTNAFWKLFAMKLSPVSGPTYDELYLIHAHLNILRDQLDMHGDAEALQLLEQIEHECC
ncbi:MAG: N(2)-fixation sustaining protein CowN [Uliginosibacterium sp.]|jgi:hypothetical protein|nr:N(2)-fixation sustaining protein CowN [Uliginosibacterium sp.]MBK9393080.1 N(2)-fixation sustaining protein CowN [Uliginosibacterium sp.]MBK9615617.1 N(2)-fixation sustaining protein CowN [Uliginosibacterium sp.]